MYVTYPCPKCQAAVTVEGNRWTEPAACPRCRAPFAVRVFPAMFRAGEGAAAAPVVSGEESSCFYHPEKIAAHVCSHCGRFLCTLCDVELRQQHVCPACLLKGKDDAVTIQTQTSHVLYDTICLWVSVLPVLIWPFTIVSAPIACFLVLRYYREPLGPLPRWRWRYWMAGSLAILQMAGWTALIVTLVR